MKFFKFCALIVIVLVCLNFAACGIGKTDVKSEPSTVTTTLGQELLDLKKAYKADIITQKEYEKAKQRLIEKRTE
jgi:hypothetical protein